MKTFFITLIFGYSLMGYCQNVAPKIVFEKTEHDFGTIKETDGKVTYRFLFTNIGSQPAIINRVQTTCGCTTSDYTKQPVLTNQKGFIDVVYDPANRPGPFSKSIMVSTNGEPANLTLKISGNVTPRPRTIEDDYPLQIGNVRLQNTQFSFLNITNTEVAEREIPIINVGSDPVTITVENTPEWLEVKQIPQVLKPNEKGVLKAKMDGSKVNDFGFVIYRMYLKVNNKSERNNMLSVTATVKEDFSKLTPEELAKAPKIVFETTNYEAGNVKAGEVVGYDFTFRNEGKNPLIIRKVRTGCGCTATTPPSDKIDAGKSSSIKVTFNTHGRKGRQAQYIDVYTNDPSNSEIKLKISCNIDE